MTRKKLLMLIGSVCLAVVLAALLIPACAAPAPPPAYKWADSLFITCGEVGGTGYVTASALAAELEKSTGMKIRVTAADPVAAYNDLVEGRCDVDVLWFTAWINATVGVGGHVIYPKTQTRVLYSAVDTPFAWYTTTDNKLKTVYDLAEGGYKVSVSMAGPGDIATAKEALPAFLGLTPEEAEEIMSFVETASWGAMNRSTVEGKADIAHGTMGSATAYEIESHPQGMRIIDLPLDDKEGWKRYCEALPGAIPTKISWGVETAIGHDGWTSPYYLVVSDDMDEELAYQLTKWFHVNYDTLKEIHVNTSRMTMDNFRYFLDSSPFPVHEGTIRYLREIGKWTSDDDKWNEQVMEIQTRWIEAWDAAAREAKAKGITIAIDNEEWLSLYHDYVAGLPPVLPRVE